MSAFSFRKVSLLKAIVWELCYRFFSSISSFCKAKGYYYWKQNFCSLCPESGLRTAPNWPKISKTIMTSQFSDMTSTSNFFDAVLFLLSSLVTGPSFMSISSPVLELWQFSFIRDWLEIRKLEIHPSEFCPISGDWGESLIECYWMLQNSRVSAFTVFELLRVNQLGGRGG